jgi:hypothetical protein
LRDERAVNIGLKGELFLRVSSLPPKSPDVIGKGSDEVVILRFHVENSRRYETVNPPDIVYNSANPLLDAKMMNAGMTESQRICEFKTVGHCVDHVHTNCRKEVAADCLRLWIGQIPNEQRGTLCL